MTELTFLWAFIQAHAAELRRIRRDERGAVTLEQVVMSAILVAAALAAGTIIYNLAVNKAGGISTDTP
ncbi:MAG: hypothetical protein AB1673_09595 [Actinomycetota bacterium]